MSKKKDLISHHIFLLPFKWSAKDGSAYDLRHFSELIDGLLSKKYTATGNNGESSTCPEWTQVPFRQNRIADYNEFHYFYDYVTEVLYDRDDNVKPVDSNLEEDRFIAHYAYNIPPGEGKYAITTNDPHKENGKKTYLLEIDSILLHLYYTGVGILSFHLNNRDEKQASPEDIININQYGRRVYPNFYFIPSTKVGFQSAFDEDDFKANYPGGAELAYQIGISLGEDSCCFFSNWREDLQKQLKKGKDYQFRLPVFLRPFLGRIDLAFNLYPVLDDRMFVISWYGSDHLSRVLGKGKLKDMLASNWWYRYVFVDGKYITIHDQEWQEQLVGEATYTRWREAGTIYGVSQYSLVMLSSSLDSLRGHYAAFLVTHLQTIYYRLAELVLVQRASIQRFSDDITHISKLDGSDPEQGSLARLLNRRYIRFINRIYFREATPQQQGIELYDLLQRQSRVPQQVNALREEIDQLQNYLQQEVDRKMATEEKRRSDILAVLGAIFLAPGLLIAVHDLGYMGTCLEQDPKRIFILTLLSAIIAARLCWWVYPADKAPGRKRPAPQSLSLKLDDYFPHTVREIPTWRILFVGVAYLFLLSIPLIYAIFACPAG